MATTKKKKTGGRKTGTPNKLTHEYRQLLASVLVGEIEALPEILENLEPNKRIDVTLKLVKYLVAPVQPVSGDDIDKAMLDLDGHKAGLNNDIETKNHYNRLGLP